MTISTKGRMFLHSMYTDITSVMLTNYAINMYAKTSVPATIAFLVQACKLLQVAKFLIPFTAASRL